MLHWAEMHELDQAITDLQAALGHFLDRNRADGVFLVQVGSPGSVAELADLDQPELQLDLLPGEPTPQQRHALSRLGYVPQGESWQHPGGWRLVLVDHGTNWRAQQQALTALLQADRGAARRYRAVFEAQGRAAADHALEGAALDHHARTVGFRPAEFMAQTLAPLNLPWMFAAGTALDLHLGQPTRPHGDVDIVFPRDHQPELMALLRSQGWRTDAAIDGRYQAWTAPLQPPHFQVHARHPDLPGVLMADFMFTDFPDDRWAYRRDPSITLPLAEARRVSPQGLPSLAPEAVLLFKSGSGGCPPRPKDEQDFQRVLPMLTAPARAWLARHIVRTQPEHPWLPELA